MIVHIPRDGQGGTWQIKSLFLLQRYNIKHFQLNLFKKVFIKWFLLHCPKSKKIVSFGFDGNAIVLILRPKNNYIWRGFVSLYTVMYQKWLFHKSPTLQQSVPVRIPLSGFTGNKRKVNTQKREINKNPEKQKTNQVQELKQFLNYPPKRDLFSALLGHWLSDCDNTSSARTRNPSKNQKNRFIQQTLVCIICI